MVWHDEDTQNWLSSNVSPLTVWEGSRLKMAGLEALPIYKSGGLVSELCGRYEALFSATPQAEPGIEYQPMESL